jgi:integrase
LRRIFNIARKNWKWKIPNPVSDIELPKIINSRVRYLDESEKERLFKTLDQIKETWLKSCVTIAIDTGLRLSNICYLQWSEVNLFNRSIVIAAEKMKNADYIGIPLTERACQTFRALQSVKATGYVFHDNGQRIYPVKVQRAFKKALTVAKIDNFHFHDLRHCYCSYLRQRGVDLHTIACLAGHRDLRITKRYAHLNVDNLREAVAKLESITIGKTERCKNSLNA